MNSTDSSNDTNDNDTDDSNPRPKKRRKKEIDNDYYCAESIHDLAMKPTTQSDSLSLDDNEKNEIEEELEEVLANLIDGFVDPPSHPFLAPEFGEKRLCLEQPWYEALPDERTLRIPHGPLDVCPSYCRWEDVE